ncbi:YgjV family protein [Testudinibacter sp. P80/BLE/0925]|uniref:YgjV family protein n=1 Tax=Testudinibacter sp. TW-1 TaxID=3417757 RepID=UPI003D367CC0
MSATLIEVLGYIATAFVAGSFLLSSMLYLRLINAIGAMMFIVYGILIASMPVVLLNVFITVVNIYQIIKLKRRA